MKNYKSRDWSPNPACSKADFQPKSTKKLSKTAYIISLICHPRIWLTFRRRSIQTQISKTKSTRSNNSIWSTSRSSTRISSARKKFRIDLAAKKNRGLPIRVDMRVWIIQYVMSNQRTASSTNRETSPTYEDSKQIRRWYPFSRCLRYRSESIKIKLRLIQIMKTITNGT